MSVDDVPTCRLRARLRQGLEKAVVSSINTSLWHNLQLFTSNCGTLNKLGHHGAVRTTNIALLNNFDLWCQHQSPARELNVQSPW